eukprot:scaffold58313_cov17-Tisochrysis_lutea.AAC.1
MAGQPCVVYLLDLRCNSCICFWAAWAMYKAWSGWLGNPAEFTFLTCGAVHASGSPVQSTPSIPTMQCGSIELNSDALKWCFRKKKSGLLHEAAVQAWVIDPSSGAHGFVVYSLEPFFLVHSFSCGPWLQGL